MKRDKTRSIFTQAEFLAMGEIGVVHETLLGTEIVDESDWAENMRDEAQRKWTRHARQHGLIHDPENEK